MSWTSVGDGGNQAEVLPSAPSIIYLQAAGHFVLDGVTMPQPSMLRELRARQVKNPLHSAIVSVSEDVDVQTLLNLIARIKQTGIEKVVMDSSGAP